MLNSLIISEYHVNSSRFASSSLNAFRIFSFSSSDFFWYASDAIDAIIESKVISERYAGYFIDSRLVALREPIEKMKLVLSIWRRIKNFKSMPLAFNMSLGDNIVEDLSTSMLRSEL